MKRISPVHSESWLDTGVTVMMQITALVFPYFHFSRIALWILCIKKCLSVKFIQSRIGNSVKHICCSVSLSLFAGVVTISPKISATFTNISPTIETESSEAQRGKWDREVWKRSSNVAHTSYQCVPLALSLISAWISSVSCRACSMLVPQRHQAPDWPFDCNSLQTSEMRWMFMFVAHVFLTFSQYEVWILTFEINLSFILSSFHVKLVHCENQKAKK